MLSYENDKITVSAQTYTLTFDHGCPFVALDDSSGHRLADLVALSSIQPLHGRDDTTYFDPWQAEENGDEVVLSVHASSTVWDSKTYRFICSPTRFSYDMEVTGHGQLAQVLYFGGTCWRVTIGGRGSSGPNSSSNRVLRRNPTRTSAVIFHPRAARPLT